MGKRRQSFLLVMTLLLVVGGGLFLLLDAATPGITMADTSEETAPPSPRSVLESRSESSSLVPQRNEIAPVSPPGLQGEVLLEGARGSLAVRVELKDHDGNPINQKEIRAPGEFDFPLWKGAESVLIEAHAQGYVSGRVYTKKGATDVLVRLRRGLGVGDVKWALAPSPSEPSPRRSRVRIYRMTDPGTEMMGTSRQDFFEGVMGSVHGHLIAFMDKWLDGGIEEAPNFTFRLASVPVGDFLISVTTPKGRGHAAHLKILRGEKTDLGLLSLSPGALTVAVYDSTTRQPIPGVRLMPILDKWVMGKGSMSGPKGLVRINGDFAQHVRAAHSAYYAKDYFPEDQEDLSDSEKAELGVPLDCNHVLWMSPVDSVELDLPVGSWVSATYLGPDGHTRAYSETVGSSGKIRLPVGKYGRILCYDPMSQDYWIRVVRDKALVGGKASLLLDAAGTQRSLEWGSVSLQHKSYRFTTSLRSGRAEMKNLPVGKYGLILRVGSLVHDNDHEYWLRERYLGPGESSLSLRLPESHLRIRLLDIHRRPLVGRKVFLTMSAPPTKDFSRIKIGIEACSDRDGVVSVNWLPEGFCHLRVGTKRLQLYTSVELQDVILP